MCLSCITLFMLVQGTKATTPIPHAPIVSYIPDQRVMTGGFVQQYFQIIDLDGNGIVQPPTTQVTMNGTFPSPNITINPCSTTGGDPGCDKMAADTK